MSKIMEINKVATVDNTPGESYDEMRQGTRWTNYTIYELVFDDRTVQHISIGQTYNSYGDVCKYEAPAVVKPTEKIITVWE